MADEDREGAKWEIVYGIDKLYLTDKEKEYLLSQLNAGVHSVEINGEIFTNKYVRIGLSQKIRDRALHDLEVKRRYG